MANDTDDPSTATISKTDSSFSMLPAVLGNRASARIKTLPCPGCDHVGQLSAWIRYNGSDPATPVLMCGQCDYSGDGQWFRGGIDFSNLAPNDTKTEEA